MKPDFVRLLSWFGKTARQLPWRDSPSPYHVLVSEFMLQQTRVDVVIPYYQRFLERFPTLEQLADSEPDEVLPFWAGLGYYSRARNLRLAARHIRALPGFPCDAAALQAIPGIGPYTAAAISSIAFGKPAVAIDGNARRVLSRFIAYRGSSDQELERLIRPEIPVDQAGNFTQAVMELGATLCRPRNPLCLGCPLQEGCQGQQFWDLIPPKKSARPTQYLEFQAVRIHFQNRILLQRQTGAAWLKGMWVVPYTEAGSQELLTRFGLEQLVAVGRIQHQITYRNINVEVFSAELRTDPKFDVPDTCWAGPEQYQALALPSLTRKIVQAGGSLPLSRTHSRALLCNQ